ncbi:mitofilin family membrane protein [Parvularcula dongshanensis]|uniref:Uncharacterized protein n=1 Tax=Parvularcula dongshanensis TaxID=1173995 RepID=A0A840HZV1_9PROT|nr:mitofilin family membrane protein [Parvularcula dongshanensis]MBB4657561.1 hypothetical protein [Parvularcula dongshanensis]
MAGKNTLDTSENENEEAIDTTDTSPSPATSDPEAVDAEIVDDEPVAAEPVTAEPVEPEAMTTDEPQAARKAKPRGAGRVWTTLVLLLVIAGAVFWLLFETQNDGTRLAGGEADPATATETRPFPGNELDAQTDRPITARAAPGTREAASRADAAAGAAAADSDPNFFAAPTTEEGPAAPARTEQAEAPTDRQNALIARAAERNRARRQAREAAAQDTGGSDAAAEGAPEPQGSAPQEERSAAAAPREDTPEPAETVAEAERQTGDDDPNFFPPASPAEQEEPTEEQTEAFTQDEAPAQVPDSDEIQSAETAPAEDGTTEAEPEQARQSAPRPTGQVAPLAGGDAVSEQPEAERDEGPQAIQPRPAVVASGQDFDERIDEVRQDLRQDVLAEAQTVIRNAIAETEAEVERLRAALSEQDQRSNQRIAQLQDRLEVLQSRDASASQQGVLVLALSNLGSQVEQGNPFARQLADVERLAPNAQSLRMARPYAAEGLPTEQELRERFSTTAREALSSVRRGDAEGVLGRLWANVTALFTVREVGEVEGDAPSAVISRAEVDLDAGDLEGALEELSALEGPARDAFAPWIEDAQARVEVQSRIDALERAALGQRG